MPDAGAVIASPVTQIRVTRLIQTIPRIPIAGHPALIHQAMGMAIQARLKRLALPALAGIVPVCACRTAQAIPAPAIHPAAAPSFRLAPQFQVFPITALTAWVLMST